MKKLLIAAACLFAPAAMAQTANVWTPQTGYFLLDGGNAPTVPWYSTVTPAHSVNIPPNGVTPGIGTFATNWGTVVTATVTGNDNAFVAHITTPASGQGAIAAQSVDFVISLAQSYSPLPTAVPDAGVAANAVYICAYQGFNPTFSVGPDGGGSPGVTPFYATEISPTTLWIQNSIAFTPAASTTYNIGCIGAGSGNIY